jgi:hypothetical protein
MTTLAEDIKALMDLGHGLGSATELAVADRVKKSKAANQGFHFSLLYYSYSYLFPFFHFSLILSLKYSQ